MPLAGKGMLLTSMNIDAGNEADFNRWYDREHLAEVGVLFGAVGGMPLLLAFYLASLRATLELTPDRLAITPLGWGRDATPMILLPTLALAAAMLLRWWRRG